jgi:hypothetical protein
MIPSSSSMSYLYTPAYDDSDVDFKTDDLAEANVIAEQPVRWAKGIDLDSYMY